MGKKEDSPMEKEPIRDKLIGVKCTPDEYQTISEKATFCAVKNATFLRNLALNYPVNSKVDQLAYLEIVKCRADLGRLGGLLKMWLSNKERRAGLNEIDVRSLYKEIEEKQEKLLEIADRLLEVAK